jgi:hypothetical protein
MTDEPDVMSNLPRSRPGRRSEKRTGSRSGKGGSKRTRVDGSGAGTGKPAARAQASRRQAVRSAAAGSSPPEAGRGNDPLADAVRIATRIAGTSLGLAAGIVRRLPRP